VHHWYQRHRQQIFPPVSLALLIPVATGVNDTGSKFPTSVKDHQWQIATGFNDTGGKFATGGSNYQTADNLK
jgi:hypothetical protein